MEIWRPNRARCAASGTISIDCIRGARTSIKYIGQNCDHLAELDAEIAQALMIAETARLGDPLRDCVAKFNGRWDTGSGQFDATRLG